MVLSKPARKFTIRLPLALLFTLFTILQISSLEIKLVWWNIENCFDTVDDPLKNDTILTSEQYSSKVSSIAALIKSFDPDLIGLAEVENKTVLADLARQTGLPYYYLVEGNDPRGIDVALLSQFPVSYISHKDHPVPWPGNKHYKFSRDCPEALLTLDEIEIVIMLNHLKSKRGDSEKNRAKQMAQCKGILDIIAARYDLPGSEPNYIIMGDFNCNRQSQPLNLLQKSGLIILNYRIKEKYLYTNIYRGEKQDIDFFLVNKALLKKMRIKEFKAIHSEEIEYISDHYPLILTLETR